MTEVQTQITGISPQALPARDQATLKQRVELFRTMNYIRCVEETIAARYAEQEMRCPTHLSVGQEAVAAGVCAALGPRDQAVSGHRAHAHYLAKGGDLAGMIAEIYGKVTGCSRGKGGSMHLVDLDAGFLGSTAIVGNTIPIGVGAALTSQILGTGRAVAVFFGDAAIEEGVFHESLNFAVVRRLPVLFVCENNLYSVYSPLSVRQPEGRRIWELAAAYGAAAACGDGNDAPSVYALTKSALCHLREAGGPVFLEFSTYRWREHCGPNYDNDLGYRTEEEYREWRERDPVARLERELREAGAMDDDAAAGVTADIEQQVAAAFAFAQSSPFPEPGDLLTDVYAEDR